MDDIVVQEFVNSLKPTPTDTNTTYGATVSRVDNEGTVWVNLYGSDKETPTASTSSEVKRGDKVVVNWRNNKLYIDGNYSDPSAGVGRVGSVEKVASSAEKKAVTAQTSADDAKKIAGNTNQYFWVVETGTDTGAHITEIPKADFINDPSGGNLLARSNGIAVRDGLVEIASFGTDAVIGKIPNGHVKVTSNGLEVWKGSEQTASNKVASFGGTVILGTTESGKVTISNDTVQIGKMILAFETDENDDHYSRINPGANESTLHIGYIGTNGDFYWKDLECRKISAKGNSEFLGNVVIGGNLSAGGNVTFRNVSTTTSSANARLGTEEPIGRLYRSSSSSKRYKHDIKDIGENSELDPYRLYDLAVRQFKYNDDYLDKDDIRANKDIAGFIAEEVYEHYPIAAELDNDGTPQDWNVRYIVPPMLRLIQELHEEVEQLKSELSQLARKENK